MAAELEPSGGSSSQQNSHDIHIKLLMLGDTGVGKTCLLVRYAYDSFSPTFITTIGIDFKIKHLDLDDVKVKLQIWDTAGQERFRTITVSYFKGAHGIILLYDVTDMETFESIRNWIQQIHDHADAAVNIVLVGNKCDGNVHGRSREVSREEGQALADEYGLKFFETSAKQNIGVEETFEAIARETKDRLQTEAAERAKMKKKDDRKKDGGTISLGAPTSEPSKRSRARCRC